MCVSLQSSKSAPACTISSIVMHKADGFCVARRSFEVGKAHIEDQSLPWLMSLFIEGRSTETSGGKANRIVEADRTIYSESQGVLAINSGESDPPGMSSASRGECRIFNAAKPFGDSGISLT